jgi:hypothetical protein
MYYPVQEAGVVAKVAAQLGVDWLARREARRTLILLREVYIHMIQNGPRDPTNTQHTQRLTEIFAWWESEVIPRLQRARARPGEISEFKALGNVATGNVIAEKLERLNEIIRRLEGRA